MIDRPALIAWRSKAPWPNPVQIEQDLLLSRLMIEMNIAETEPYRPRKTRCGQRHTDTRPALIHALSPRRGAGRSAPTAFGYTTARADATQHNHIFFTIHSRGDQHPRKEHWLGEYGPGLNVPFVMAAGGAIDIVAGITRRAPHAWQRLGIEWLYRVLQEPRRMLRRYLVTNTQFSILVVRAMVARAFRPRS